MSDTPLSDREFLELARIVQGHIGIKMPITKKPMVASRLLRRVHELQMTGYEQYCCYLRSAQGWLSEESHFCDLLTTHKTHFFREPEHFDLLVNSALPRILARDGSRQAIRIWSAACSTGEEAYTLAMVLFQSLCADSAPRFTFTVLGTDISEFVLRTARNAIYPASEADDIPMPLRKQFLLQGISTQSSFVRIVPELRSCTTFRRLNFMSSEWAIRGHFDVIFCRNVLIYFDAPIQHRIIAALCGYLVCGGYLFLGHAECADVTRLPLEALGHTIYRKTATEPRIAQ